MYTRTLSTASNAEQFYFQIKLLELRSKVSQNKLFKFSIYKGKYLSLSDYTKEPIKMTGKNITLG
jgi:AAA15 family ATPase/GTPase